AHAEAVEIGTLVRLEGRAIVLFHQRHAEFVQVIGLPRAHGGEHLRAGNIFQLVEGIETRTHDRAFDWRGSAGVYQKPCPPTIAQSATAFAEMTSRAKRCLIVSGDTRGLNSRREIG